MEFLGASYHLCLVLQAVYVYVIYTVKTRNYRMNRNWNSHYSNFRAMANYGLWVSYSFFFWHSCKHLFHRNVIIYYWSKGRRQFWRMWNESMDTYYIQLDSRFSLWAKASYFEKYFLFFPFQNFGLVMCGQANEI